MDSGDVEGVLVVSRGVSGDGIIHIYYINAWVEFACPFLHGFE